MHDMDAIIEVSNFYPFNFIILLHRCHRTDEASGKQIVCQGPVDRDDISEQQDSDPARKDHLEGGNEADDLQQDDADHADSYSPGYTGNKRGFEPRRAQLKNAVSNDGVARKDVSHLRSENSDPDREISVPREERYIDFLLLIPFSSLT